MYEVLDSNLHKYSSTAVSGGGSNVHGGIDHISTTVTHHSDQELWVRDVDSDQERQFQFSQFNVAARPGHKLLVIWDRLGNRMERIVNKNTEVTNAAGGVYNTWAPRNQFLRHPLGRFLFNPVMMAGLSLIPFLGWLMSGLMHLLGVFTGKLSSAEGGLRSGLTRLYNGFVAFCIMAHALFSLSHWNMIDYGQFGSTVIFMLLHFLMMPVNLLAYYLGNPLGSWWTVSLGLAAYIYLATVLINIHHQRRIAHASKRIDEYAKKVEQSHPAFQ
ncbi:hypothetical protein J2T60_001178 [Natronospira proteinivora]|uniref:Uncharacterized protein n=1 Tax=Natronospira proteinivora TaxID=1807133 RepID=A0ABT1G7D3_9GAMM|nr:hypothetical protein [Natronospira proteinivora]MCP1727213.1 hypothetical protein [Natronospira proteinivora]